MRRGHFWGGGGGGGGTGGGGKDVGSRKDQRRMKREINIMEINHPDSGDPTGISHGISCGSGLVSYPQDDS